MGAGMVVHLLLLKSMTELFIQKTLPVGGNLTVQLVSCLTGMNSEALLHTNNNIFYCLVKSNLETLQTSRTEILGLLKYLSECSVVHPS